MLNLPRSKQTLLLLPIYFYLLLYQSINCKFPIPSNQIIQEELLNHLFYNLIKSFRPISPSSSLTHIIVITIIYIIFSPNAILHFLFYTALQGRCKESKLIYTVIFQHCCLQSSEPYHFLLFSNHPPVYQIKALVIPAIS